MTNEILKTENEEYGFYGTTFINYSEEETQKRWEIAFKTLIELSGAKVNEIREFLDSRIGRHLADQCYDKEDVAQTIKENYFGWLDRELFDDKNSTKQLETEKDTALFGTRVFNSINNRYDIILYTYQNKNRIHQDYAVCVGANQSKYRIGMDYLTPIEE